MIDDNVDVPFDGRQTLAFRVASDGFDSLREALRVAYTEGDGRLLSEQWARLQPAHERQRARVRWQVPSTTLLEAVEEYSKGFTRTYGTKPDPKMSARLEQLRAGWAQRLGAAKEVQLHPERWLRLATSMRYQLRPFLARQFKGAVSSFYWDYWLKQFEDLGSAPEPDDAPPYNPSPVLTKVRGLRFFLEEFDRDSRCSRRGAEVAPTALRSITRDYVLQSDGKQRPLWHVLDEVWQSISLRDHLDLLVGPHVRSMGPGPFLSHPPSAEPIVSSAWDMLPLYRVRDEHGRWTPPVYRFARGPSLEHALRTVAEGRRMGRKPKSSKIFVAGWSKWTEVQREWWPRCRERYLQLLQTAHDDGDVVVFGQWLPDDQGTVHSPLSDDLGVRVMV